ncbi:DUF1353 domain-containing protein [Pseudomonas fluorescens]|uniref:DUF1353 domain-containing protein n=1 Tax=Pseudomonas fluorescens TaxID=294 RepID=UPI001A9CC74C|nr:DUF1353 domain-containing protein [Pseudomonas fluorescens]QTD31457.1 DUF1353 domain-containing protein [Pseudomonas fluorescens]
MTDDSFITEELKREQLGLERYKANLDYKKFVLSSVFVAIAVAAIPPLFQLGTAVLEQVRSNAERREKSQQFRADYIKQFVDSALNQDIELRIRFAQYFARVSTESSRNDWIEYLNDLYENRKAIRIQINQWESEWWKKATVLDRDEAEIAELERNLAWAYNEVGYVERNRSAAGNPRQPESGHSPPMIGNPFFLSSFADQVYYVTQPVIWSAQQGFSGKVKEVRVPAGFVLGFDTIPDTFWALLKPDIRSIQILVVYDYLYWTQTTTRQEADEILKAAMQGIVSDPMMLDIIYKSARESGQSIWDKNAKLKSKGERRILKELPSAPDIRWEDWKKRTGVFS